MPRLPNLLSLVQQAPVSLKALVTFTETPLGTSLSSTQCNSVVQFDTLHRGIKKKNQTTET